VIIISWIYFFRQHKRALTEAEEKIKKLESTREKLEKSREEAISNLNEKSRMSSEEYLSTIQNLKEDLSRWLKRRILSPLKPTIYFSCLRRDSIISGLNKKVDQMGKELSEKTGNASEAYSKLLEAHDDTQRVCVESSEHKWKAENNLTL